MQITLLPLRLPRALAAACIAACATGTQGAGLQALEWAAATNGTDVAWADGNSYCAALQDEGHDDWRLPTLAEFPDPSGSATGAAPTQYYWGLLLDGGIEAFAAASGSAPSFRIAPMISFSICSENSRFCSRRPTLGHSAT